MVLVETAGAEIALKGPEAESALRVLCKLEECTADAAALAVRVNIKMIHPAGTKSDKARHNAGVLTDPNWGVGKNNAGKSTPGPPLVYAIQACEAWRRKRRADECM